MSVFDRPASSRDQALFDSTVVRAWYAQLAEASKTPGLVQHLVHRTGELLPRFASYFDRLRALPRRIRRALGRRGGLSLARLALLLALCGGPLHAAVISVNGTTCSLANAIVSANTDTATGGCTAGSGSDQVKLDANVTLAASLPSLTSSVKIQSGMGSIVDGNGNACFVIEPAGNVVLKGLTIQNCAAAEGAGVFNRGTLTITRSRITSNGAAGDGGGVSNDGAGINVGSLTIKGSDISGNTAANGGGVATDYGVVKISDTTISGNIAEGDGGGVLSYGGKVTLTNCTVSGNTAGRGGGATAGFYFTPDFDAAVLKVQKCTISGNTAVTRGGGGIALYQRGALNLSDSTISGNSAVGEGGGVAADTWYGEGFLTVVNSTISGNSSPIKGGGIALEQGQDSPRVTLKHALISGNNASTVPEMAATDGPFTLTVNDYNLFGSNGDAGVVGFTPGATDIVPAAGVMTDDILDPLGNNGGPTQTHALVPGGPAVDAVPTADGNCIGTTDQRGIARPQGSGCDIGAFELEQP